MSLMNIREGDDLSEISVIEFMADFEIVLFEELEKLFDLSWTELISEFSEIFLGAGC